MITSPLKTITLLTTTLMVSGVIFSGCLDSASAPSSSTTTTVPAEKQGDTTRTGVLTQSNGTFFLQETGKIPEAIDSYAVDLSQYVGQTITVTGQFSGDTLFVGKVE